MKVPNLLLPFVKRDLLVAAAGCPWQATEAKLETEMQKAEAGSSLQQPELKHFAWFLYVKGRLREEFQAQLQAQAQLQVDP